MNIQVELGQLIGLAVALIGAFIGGAKLFFAQADRRLDERFTTQERERSAQLETFMRLFRDHADDERRHLERIDAEMKAQASRIAHLEAHAEDSPTHGDLSALYEKINAVAGAVSAQGGKLDGIDANLRLILSKIADRGMK